jgi:uncharacterized Zn finger protein (UPF0148 family)
MGADFQTTIIPACPAREVPARFSEIVESARRCHGSRGYTGSFAEKDRVSAESRVFATEDQAYDYLSETCDKHGAAGAVRFVHEGNKQPPDAEALRAKAAKLEAEARAIPVKARERIMGGRAKKRTCVKCGSSIATNMIFNRMFKTACPVCQNPDFMVTASERKRMTELTDRARAVTSDANTRLAEWSKAEVANADPQALRWMIGASCAS